MNKKIIFYKEDNSYIFEIIDNDDTRVAKTTRGTGKIQYPKNRIHIIK